MLIENGILRGYMQDKLNARLMNVAATGNGRRNPAHVPMPRMTNTYMLPGQDTQKTLSARCKRRLCGEFWRWLCGHNFGAFCVLCYRGLSD